MRILAGRDGMPRKRVEVRWLWEPRDLWVGVFWNRALDYLLVYVCLVPCLPLVVSIRKSAAGSRFASGLEVASSPAAETSNQESSHDDR